MLAQARERIDVLVYAALFLHEAYPRLNELLSERAAEGCLVRIAVGDADSHSVQQRGQEERFGHGIESRCRLALMHYRPLIGGSGIEVRTHGTTLYNSLYCADDQLLVNAHAWGVNAYSAPVWHLRRSGSGDMFDTYAESFNAVWATAVPTQQEGGLPAPSASASTSSRSPTGPSSASGPSPPASAKVSGASGRHSTSWRPPGTWSGRCTGSTGPASSPVRGGSSTRPQAGHRRPEAQADAAAVAGRHQGRTGRARRAAARRPAVRRTSAGPAPPARAPARTVRAGRTTPGAARAGVARPRPRTGGRHPHPERRSAQSTRATGPGACTPGRRRHWALLVRCKGGGPLHRTRPSLTGRLSSPSVSSGRTGWCRPR